MKTLKTYYKQIVLLLVGIGFVLTGVIRGEEGIVFEKAIKVCLECIGIG